MVAATVATAQESPRKTVEKRAPRGQTTRDRTTDRQEDTKRPVREREDPRRRRPDTQTPPPPPADFSAQPAPSWIPWIPPTVWQEEDRIELDCPDHRVCAVDPLDEYLAWRLAAQTTIPWRHFIDGRIAERTWWDLLVELEVSAEEVYAALGRDLPEDELDYLLADETLSERATEHLRGVRLPAFACTFPIPIEGWRRFGGSGRGDGSYGTRELDWTDEAIADRIEEETGWCRDELLLARSVLGSWSAAARRLYLSPFLFEASFGIPLETQVLGSTKRVRYPAEEEIRDVAEFDRWPELR